MSPCYALINNIYLSDCKYHLCENTQFHMKYAKVQQNLKFNILKISFKIYINISTTLWTNSYSINSFTPVVNL